MIPTRIFFHTTFRAWSVFAVAAAALHGDDASTAPATDEAATYELPPYVVVATRTPLGLDRVSPSVSYISDATIERWQDDSLVDSLRREPGMVVWSNGSEGSLTSLSIRGTESNHTGFFIDGRRLTPGFGNQYNLDYLSVENLSSVQVLRGASSVHYGSSSIGGVVQLETQSGLDADAPTGSVSAEVGANEYFGGEFSFLTGSANYGISVAGRVLTTENERPNDHYEDGYLNSRFDYRLTEDLAFELLAFYSKADKGLPASVQSPKPNDEQTTTSWMVSPGIRYATDLVTVDLFYARSEYLAELYQENEAFSPVFPFPSLGFFPIRNEIEVLSDEVGLQVDYSVNDDLLLTLGAAYRSDDASNSNLNTFSPLEPADPYDETFGQQGYYAQALWMIGNFELRGGARYDNYTDFDDRLTGSAELVYYLNALDAALFAKAATSYAPPGASDLAFDSDTSTPLDAEESRSFEIGWRQSLMEEDLTYSLVAFRNEIDELIDFVYDPMTFGFDSVNVEEATTEGIEFQVQYTGIDKLELGFNYTYLRAVADYQDDPRTAFVFGMPDPAEDVRLARRPRHLVQASAHYRFSESLTGGIEAVGYFDRKDIDPNTFVLTEAEDYVVTRLVADWQLNENLSIFGRVENLLDESYAAAAGFPALGRAGYIGARFEF